MLGRFFKLHRDYSCGNLDNLQQFYLQTEAVSANQRNARRPKHDAVSNAVIDAVAV